MLPVEIHPIQDALVLRARGSELLILADHVAELKKLKSAGDFSKYFLHEALVNRPARKLFEAWLRKDGSLWARIYKTVQTIETSGTGTKTSAPKPAKAKETVEQQAEGSAKAETTAKKLAKPAAKTSEKPAAAKVSKKEEPKTAKVEAKKAASKAAAKPAEKTATKIASKPAAKPAPKKSSKK